MKYQHVLDSLLDQFSDRFSQFRSLEQTMKIIKYPDVVVYSILELNGFQWMQIDDLEMQLAEFQDSMWAQVFVDLRSKLENLERCCLENQEECHYEQEIWSAWNPLPDTFSTLKNISMALLTIFPSTYFCEALFSALNNIKTNKRNRLTDEVSSACLGLKYTKYQPSIEDLANEIQQQKVTNRQLDAMPPPVGHRCPLVVHCPTLLQIQVPVIRKERENYITRHQRRETMGRQRNSSHKKEKQASPEKEVNKLEASNLSEKEFREMVIRWLKRMEEKIDNMSKNQEEMKKNQEEMKNDIVAVKNSIESIKSRLEEAEDHISELEDKMEKILK
ncbi:hypothetical protein QTO34_000557 [Cnephaeus nilssonii]|uniref:HAT C-terminal dimerisation domain-containing protein n=1 Tax=Cnephaeus nilssonii TaxID=3371016 RepID=A0AA40LX23_CNENI|nr:hypothetical protein QTO34_000557 [Eptesicus nilssonii]